jgi:hypothetical protein
MSTTTVLNDVKLLLGLQTDDEKLDTHCKTYGKSTKSASERKNHTG